MAESWSRRQGRTNLVLMGDLAERGQLKAILADLGPMPPPEAPICARSGSRASSARCPGSRSSSPSSSSSAGPPS